MNPKRYGLWAAGTVIFLQALSMIALAAFDFDISNAGMIISPPMVASMIEGQKWVRENKSMPETKDMWRWSRMGGVIILGVYMIAFVILAFLMPEFRNVMAQPALTGWLLLMLFAISGFSSLVNRWLLGIAARSEFARLNK
jgi:magnesium-transporting ATPase (P-type)